MIRASGWFFCVVVLFGWTWAGCSGKREVAGQVFVVTKGGENVKLGLVGIHVVDRVRLAEIAGPLLGKAITNKANGILLKELAAEIEQLIKAAPPGAESPLEEVSKAVAKRVLVENLAAQSTQDTLFNEFPPAVTQTDADGVFTVEATETDWLAARGQRRAGDSTENYLWLVPLKGVQKKLLISNDRMLEGSEDLLLVLAQFSPATPAMSPAASLAIWAIEQRAAAQKALVEAKAKMEAEEKERQRLADVAEQERLRAIAEAKAKVEAAEAAIASKLGLSRPFAAGLQGRCGTITVRWIPAGRFTMGSPLSEDGRESDEIQHEVVISSGFFLAETECTQAQWEAVMGRNPSEFKGADRPVEMVSWDDAVEFCRKLTAKQQAEGLCPEGWEWRLPTEAEWEYAARAGTIGARYGEVDAIAWHQFNSDLGSHAIKGKKPNAWNLYDMIGNIWEWCGGWYGDYPTEAESDPPGPGSGARRVIRGGSWFGDTDSVRSARSARRLSFVPDDRSIMVGFRPALSSAR
jgi:formylglycine-generating enzyme required for sulfatase activity